jgi:bifunctional UDP-N-acetylglucosamine pyrophosphorylase/glucosamine-1-phosphate N-acetyltransferase
MEIPVNVLILAAGLGTRMKSRKAKVLHQAGGMPLIEHVVRTALELAAAQNVTVVVGHQAGEVQAVVSAYGVRFAVQAEQGGTGHAVMAAREAVGEHTGLLVVLYGDCPLLAASTLRELLERQRESGAAATVITTVLDDPTGYGRIVTDPAGRLLAIVEQKAASEEQLRIREINSGIYCFTAELLWKHLDEIGTGNPAGEYYLTDIIEIFQRHGFPVATFRLDDATEVLGINNRVELAAVDKVLREKKVRQLMLGGVTIERPETVTIDQRVRIGIDSVVEPFAQILGETAIGEECRIGSGAIIRDSRLGDGVEVGPYTLVNRSVLEAGAKAGPFSRLRFDNHLEAGSAVGNFVELKKTRLGRRSKALHLAYLGDAAIEESVNIGAGTITCNYDGASKHPTTIRRGVFVGSNATLVAPLELGDGSYIGAGSVITDPVPADALALGRARQVNKEGWAKKRRARTQAPSVAAGARPKSD